MTYRIAVTRYTESNRRTSSLPCASSNLRSSYGLWLRATTVRSVMQPWRPTDQLSTCLDHQPFGSCWNRAHALRIRLFLRQMDPVKMFKRSVLTATISMLLVAHASAENSDALVSQVGDFNFVSIQQEASEDVGFLNAADVNQAGIGNRIETQQQSYGSRNAVNALQGGNRNASSLNQSGGDQTVSVDQQGSDNDLAASQFGYGNTAALSQSGDANTISVEQYSYEVDHRLAVTQAGMGNSASVSQYDNASDALVSQDGDRNIIDLQQSSWANQYVGQQIGNDNVARVDQAGGGSAQTIQTGDGNHIDLQQIGWPFGASTSVSQDGTANSATVYHTDAGRYSGGSMSISQGGQANDARASKTSAWGGVDFVQTGGGNALNADQGGRNITLIGSSTGDDNSVDVSQDGDNHSLDIVQNGSDNMIVASQNGYWGQGDNGTISQTGMSNFASLTQNPAGVEGMSTDSATIIQSGNGNSATILQGQ